VTDKCPGSIYFTGQREEVIMLRCIFRCARNEEGVETLEWIAMGALIVGVLLVVYPGTLGATINGVMSALQTKLAT
jgi:hypothetical protein